MTDTREEILTQLGVILSNCTGYNFYRNRRDLDDVVRPAIVLLDGDENIAMDDDQVNRFKSGRMPPAIFALKPEIFVILKQRDTTANDTVGGVLDPIGPAISAARLMVMDAVENDPTLLSLLTRSGQIVFLGSQTDMKAGSTIMGKLVMLFEFRYVLFPPAQ